MLAKFGTNSGGITWWSNFELIQVEPHTFGQIWTNTSGILFSWRDNSSYRLYTLGLLCLWQCFFVQFLSEECGVWRSLVGWWNEGGRGRVVHKALKMEMTKRKPGGVLLMIELTNEKNISVPPWGQGRTLPPRPNRLASEQRHFFLFINKGGNVKGFFEIISYAFWIVFFQYNIVL